MGTTFWLVLGVFALFFAAGFWLLYVRLMGKSFLPKSPSIQLFNNKMWWLFGVIALIAGLGWWYWGDISKLDFASMFALAVALYIVGRLIKSGANLGWKSAPYYAGLAAVVLTLWFNGAGDLTKVGLNKANAAAKSLATGSPSLDLTCPKQINEAKLDVVYKAVSGCEPLRLVGKLPTGKIFKILEGGTGTTLEENLKVNWPNTDIHTVSVAPGKTGQVVFTIISAEKSAEEDRAAAEPATDYDRLLNTKPVIDGSK